MSDKPLRTSNWNAEQLQDNMSDTIARQLQTLQEEGVRAGDTITTPMITSSYDSESEASNAITTLGRLGLRNSCEIRHQTASASIKRDSNPNL